MQIRCNGVLFDEMVNCKSLQESLEHDLVRLDYICRAIVCLENEDFVGTEGILIDTVNVGVSAVKNTAKAGAKTYGAINKAYLKGKNKWKTYWRPLLTKTIKEIGNILQNMYMKFTKVGKRYKVLGDKINVAIKDRLRQIGLLPAGFTLKLHDFEAYVLKGYIDIIENYENFFDEVLMKLAPDFKPPEQILSSITSKRTDDINTSATSISKCISEINQYGDISIPWAVFKSNRYMTFFKSLVNWKPTKEDMQGSLSDFVKRTVLGKEIEYTLSVDDGPEFKRVAGAYLKIMSSVLNNQVVEKALNEGGKKISATVKEQLAEVDKVSTAAETAFPEFKPNNSEADEQGNVDQKAQEDPNKATKEAIDSYIQNISTFIAKTSTAFSGIVRGVLSAMFDLVNETETILTLIDQSIGNKQSTDTVSNNNK